METVSYGLNNSWSETQNEGLRETNGWRGHKALTLSALGRNPFLAADIEKQDIRPEDIDLLLLATPTGLLLPVNHYSLESPLVSVSTDFAARGEASIRLGTHPVVLRPTEMAMWTAGKEWNDFTLDFRLRPTSLRNGEIFFSWSGRDISGKTQSVIARVERRRLIWEFTNFFRYGSSRSLNITLKSPPLIPGEWRHHQIRFKRDLLLYIPKRFI